MSGWVRGTFTLKRSAASFSQTLRRAWRKVRRGEEEEEEEEGRPRVYAYRNGSVKEGRVS